MALNEFLKKSREKKGYTQDEAGKTIGVSTATIQNWENNRSKPDINILSSIAAVYHISLDELGRNLISELKKDRFQDTCESFSSFPGWLRSFPDFPEINDLKELQMSEDEVRIFLIIALHSRFNANPMTEILKYYSDYIYIDNIITKLIDYGLYVLQPLEWYQSEDNSRYISTSSYNLTKLGFTVFDIIKEKHITTFNVFNLNPKQLTDVMCEFHQSGIFLARYNFIKNLVENEKIPLNYYDEVYYRINDRCKIINYRLPEFLSALGVEHVNYDFCIRNNIKYTVAGYLEWLNIDDFYYIEEEEYNGAEYVSARNLYLKKKEFYDANKELAEGLREPKEVAKIALKTARPTQKAIDFINLLSDKI